MDNKMSEQSRPDDFETQWQRKLGQAVEDLAESELKERVLEGGVALQDPSPSREKLLWTCDALEVLAESVDERTRQEILTRCHCWYPKEDLLDVKMTFRVNRDIDEALDMLQAKFEAFLHEGLQLEDELIETIIERGWGVAGTRQGNTIISTKIPKSGYLREYFQEEDPLEKRRLYCHCPRVRDEVRSEPTLPPEYCYCGAGFYQGIWEEILGEPVEVEVLESVMHGGDVCRIAIYLP
jgi:hypothetical protein